MNSLQKKSVIKIARMQKHLLQALHKSVRIRSSSGPHFPVFGLNTESYGVTENLSVFSPNAGKCGPEFSRSEGYLEFLLRSRRVTIEMQDVVQMTADITAIFH